MDAYPLALIEGALVDQDGCLELRHAGGERWIVLWLLTTSLSSRAGEPVVVENGKVVGRTGQPIKLSGGEFTDAAFGGEGLGTAWALSIAGDTLPERCQTGEYWLAATIED